MILDDKFELLTFDDVLLLFGAILFVVLVAIVFFEIIYFVPKFIKSLVKSVRNPSTIWIDENALDTTLDKNTLHHQFNLDKKKVSK